MGKGDIKTRRGKIANGSYGVRRNRKEEVKTLVAPVAVTKPAKKEAPKARKAEVLELA